MIAGIKTEVQRLRSLYPSYKLKVTGHSLGGALALLTAMDLKNAGFTPSVISFGQPRTGDEMFANCASDSFPIVRLTHLKDIVPQIPPKSWEYFHVHREAYESTSTSSNPQVITLLK